MKARYVVALFAFWSAPVVAQDIGQTVVPSVPVVVYSAPPTGLFGNVNAIAAISDQGGATATYDLRAIDNGSYTVGAESMAQPGDLTVLSTQDVAQGETSKRWLQIGLGAAKGNATGWVLCGDTSASLSNANQPCQNFQLK